MSERVSVCRPKLTLQPGGFLALVLWTIKTLSLLPGHCALLLDKKEGPVFSLGRVPTLWLESCWCIASHRVASRRAAWQGNPRETSNEACPFLPTQSLMTHSLEQRVVVCVIPGTARRRAASRLRAGTLMPQPLPTLTRQCRIFVPSAWTSVQGDPQG